MRYGLRLAGVAIACLVAAFHHAFAVEPVSLPGSSWSIALPEEFKLVTNPKPLFLHPVGIKVSVEDGPLAVLPPVKPGSSMAGGTVESVKPVYVVGRPGLLMRVVPEGGKGKSFVLLLQGKRGNVLVTVRFPIKGASGRLIEEVSQSLETIRELKLSVDEQMVGMPFRVPHHHGFRIASVEQGKTAVFTDGPRNDVARVPEQAVAVVTMLPSKAGAEGVSSLMARRTQMPDGEELIRTHFPGAWVSPPEIEAASAGSRVRWRFVQRVAQTEVHGTALLMPAGKSVLAILTAYPAGMAVKKVALDALIEGIRPQ